MTVLRLDRLGPETIALLHAVDAAADGAVLVGGAVRDVCLRRASGRPLVDVDVAVPVGAMDVARRVADRIGGAFFPLDVERGTARVVAGVTRLDMADFRAPTLGEDLAARDFTVNALAVPLHELLRRGTASIVDPTGGLADLAATRLRCPRAGVLADDPVRTVRGVRLEVELGFRLTPATARAIRTVARDLQRVAPERIRDELQAILRTPRASRAFRRLDALKLLEVILPEIGPMRGCRQPAPHRFTVLEHSLRALGGADRLVERLGALSPFGDELILHMAEPVGGGFERRDVLKLAAFVHDVSKPETRAVIRGRIRFFEHDVRGATRARAIGERLRLPERATALLERLVRHHLRIMHLEQTGEVTRRARYRFFRDLGPDTRDVLLLALVDGAAVRGESPLHVWRRSGLVRELLAGWPEEQDRASAPPLVRGDDVMQHFGLAPGPVVGRLLERVREAQALGLVHTRAEALAYLDSSGAGS